jgi:hypothetical protein
MCLRLQLCTTFWVGYSFFLKKGENCCTLIYVHTWCSVNSKATHIFYLAYLENGVTLLQVPETVSINDDSHVLTTCSIQDSGHPHHQTLAFAQPRTQQNALKPATKQNFKFEQKLFCKTVVRCGHITHYGCFTVLMYTVHCVQETTIMNMEGVDTIKYLFKFSPILRNLKVLECNLVM